MKFKNSNEVGWIVALLLLLFASIHRLKWCVWQTATDFSIWNLNYPMSIPLGYCSTKHWCIRCTVAAVALLVFAKELCLFFVGCFIIFFLIHNRKAGMWERMGGVLTLAPNCIPQTIFSPYPLTMCESIVWDLVSALCGRMVYAGKAEHRIEFFQSRNGILNTVCVLYASAPAANNYPNRIYPHLVPFVRISFSNYILHTHVHAPKPHSTMYVDGWMENIQKLVPFFISYPLLPVLFCFFLLCCVCHPLILIQCQSVFLCKFVLDFNLSLSFSLVFCARLNFPVPFLVFYR